MQVERLWTDGLPEQGSQARLSQAPTGSVVQLTRLAGTPGLRQAPGHNPEAET